MIKYYFGIMQVITQTTRAPFTVQSIPVSVSHTPSALTMNKKTGNFFFAAQCAKRDFTHWKISFSAFIQDEKYCTRLDWDRKLKSRTLLALYCTKSWWEQVVTDYQGMLSSKLKSRTLLALYCTKSWWGQVVTDYQGITEKRHKYITMLS